MSEENEIQGLKFTINDGGAGKEPVVPEEKKEIIEEDQNAITNTKSRTSRKG